MNPISKRRLPASLRRLLTDISPKEEWTEVDSETSDGIILPSRGAAATPEELLTPASDRTSTKSRDDSRRAVCSLCSSKPSLYTCPRCNVPYCSLLCYKSPEHLSCSEDFYKESVLREIKGMGKTEAEGRKKMQEILIGLGKKAENTDGGMEGLLKEEGVLSPQEDAKNNAKAMELLSRLAELQEGDEENAEEIEAVLRDLHKLEAGDDSEEAEEEEELDLAERLQGLDLDELSEEQLWNLLNKTEQEKFVGLIKRGALGGLVSLWRPWWEEHEEERGQELVEELQESGNGEVKDTINTGKKTQQKSKGKIVKGEKAEDDVPQISTKIPRLSSLCANPSPLVGFSLINVLFGYSFSLCFFNGDTESLLLELCDMILALSEALNSNKVFSSVQEALDSGEQSILSEGYSLKDNSAVESVAHILTGRNHTDSKGYCLSALSQLRSLLSRARASLSKDGEEGKTRQKYFMAGKKCEFLQAWVMENDQTVTALAADLWILHREKESEKCYVNKAKSAIEQSWKKGGRRENRKLVEEL